ncbi:MAG: SAM-dependent chlorinase/fluorinase [Acidobacteria bacterium]|nr:SAM-dependent chlorinase/fluorinase [Acidobacteriota bacterium]
MTSGIVTLTTDFGLSDHYVGVMKGVILRFNPQARIVDLCHQVPAYDLLGAGFILAASYSYFAPGTVHLVVVDPGVGSPRRPIVVEAEPWLFVAPDNGVLEPVYRRCPHRVWALQPEIFALKPISNTFHGRDVFAPAAGLLSRGDPPERMAEPIEDFARLEIPSPREIGPGRREGQVLHVDSFGNLITNFQPENLPQRFLLTVGRVRTEALRSVYAQADPGEIFAIAGSSGFVEISIHQASAAEEAGVGAGAAVGLVDRDAVK